MGWGALMGLGQGLQGGADLIGQKRQLDWQATQQDVAHQRKVALEELSARNKREYQQEQFGQQEKMFNLQQTAQSERDKELRAQGMEDYEKKLGLQRGQYTWEQEQQREGAKLKAKDQMEMKENMLMNFFKENDYSAEDQQKIRASVLFGISPEKAKESKPPSEAMFRAAENAFDALAMEDKVKPEQRAKWVRDVAWGMAMDPKATRGAITRGSGDSSSVGKYEPSDAIELASLSEKDAMQMLQGIRDKEGEDVWRKAMSDYREAKQRKEQEDSEPGALSSMWSSVKDFATRDGREKREDEMTPQERFQKMYNKNKPVEQPRKINQYGY